MRRLLAPAALGLMLALAGGCASPPAQFYTLSASTAPGAATAARALSVSVGPVSIPAQVDRPQMVLNLGTNELKLDEMNRWAAPLADQLTQVTVQNLTKLLGTAEVWPATAGAAARAELRVGIDIVSFEARPGEAVQVDARWSVRRGSGTRNGRTQVSEASVGPGADALAAAYSRALARMAADIAAAIQLP